MISCAKIDSCKFCGISELFFNKKNIEKGYGRLYGWSGGSAHPKYFFVGLNPSKNRFKNLEYAFGGEDFEEGTGAEFVKMLKDLDVLRDSYVTNLVKCSTTTNTVSTSYMERCFKILQEEIDMIDPKVIIALGSEVYHFLTLQNLNIPVVRVWHPNCVISYNRDKMKEYNGQLKKVCLGRC
jgi:uracil-DNA glycosylase